MEMMMRVPEVLKSFRETRLSALRPPTEFFDHQRLSRPADFTQATSRITYNTRYFSGNYGLIVLVLAVYALVTNPLLLFSIAFLVGGFAAINKFAPEPIQIGNNVITPKSLYIGLFVIGLPLMFIAGPVTTFFWLVGASSFIILSHAALMEPGIESEYASLESGGAA